MYNPELVTVMPYKNKHDLYEAQKRYRVRKRAEHENNKKMTEKFLADAKKRTESDNNQNYLSISEASTRTIFTFPSQTLTEADLPQFSHKRTCGDKKSK